MAQRLRTDFDPDGIFSLARNGSELAESARFSELEGDAENGSDQPNSAG